MPGLCPTQEIFRHLVHTGAEDSIHLLRPPDTIEAQRLPRILYHMQRFGNWSSVDIVSYHYSPVLMVTEALLRSLTAIG